MADYHRRVSVLRVPPPGGSPVPTTAGGRVPAPGAGPDRPEGAAPAHDADRLLVERARAGEAAAVDALVERLACARRFVLLHNQRCGGPLGLDEVEDAVQETLFAVWRKLDRYAGSGSLEAWVWRFAQLEFLSRLRTRRRLQRIDELQVPDPAGEAPELARHERLYRSLERIPEAYASVIRLKHLEPATFDEVAARLAIPVNTAKTRYYRGLRLLRQALRGAQDELEGEP